MTRSSRHRESVLAALLVGAAGAALALVACGGAAQPEPRSAVTVRVLVRDINIRPVGVDCAGTGAYTFFHNRAPFRILGPAGEVLAAGELPPGTSVAAFEEDLEVERIPTYCEFAVPVEVADQDGYRLVVDDRPPIELTRDDSEGPALVAVVPS
ncbi:hypothetical protein [Micromonospora sp. NBC_01813]|uniref:hypothetical protein n=1 Tax=Micromonospora sp. NBC_01813 TaxID=2975988 RepID=UPI002DD9A2D4|nr:hypothetical protein [Micromonospora sp. NBC_01813]WSA08629.1 hypothetical protein OG958_31390 [Micromonospora sp. NBC_01813]